jgi:hypothetical protein
MCFEALFWCAIARDASLAHPAQRRAKLLREQSAVDRAPGEYCRNGYAEAGNWAD